MAFCSNCGKESNENAIVCPACGCPVAAKRGAIDVDKKGNHMAFCSTCGKEIHENAIVCPACGCPVAAKRGISDKPAWDGGIMFLLVALAFFVPIAGWIIGGMNLKYPDRNGQSMALIGTGIAGFLIVINMMG